MGRAPPPRNSIGTRRVRLVAPRVQPVRAPVAPGLHNNYEKGEHFIKLLVSNGLRNPSPKDLEDHMAIEWGCTSACGLSLTDCVVFHTLLFLLFMRGDISVSELQVALTQKGHTRVSVDKLVDWLKTPYAPTQLKEYLENMYSNMTGGSYPTERELEQLKMQLPLPLPQ